MGSCCAHIYVCLLGVCLQGADAGEENGHILEKKTHKAGKIASIRGKQPHVYRVIILKQKADYRHARDRGLLGSFHDCGHMINFR